MTIEPYKKKRILGIFRGFPGLGRVVAGVSLLETLRDKYDYEIKFISYLQGNKYLRNRGYTHLKEVTPMDYCSIGLLPTNKMGVYIHNTIKEFMPDVIAIDGEPLILQSIKISYPEQHVVTLLNPADVYNPNNDKEAMDFFNALYSLSDLAIVHGLRKIKRDYKYKNIISINTIIRHEIIKIKNIPTNNIYCLLGGGTVNVDQQFEESTLTIGRLSKKVAIFLPEYTIHIVCSSPNIFKILKDNNCSNNVLLHKDIISAKKYYSDACLIITRSGRNTLSELAYLGIPAISFVSGCSYRKVEQTNNIKDINIPTITLVPKDVKVDTLAKICHKLISKKTSISLLPGNDEAIQSILDVKKI